MPLSIKEIGLGIEEDGGHLSQVVVTASQKSI